MSLFGGFYLKELFLVEGIVIDNVSPRKILSNSFYTIFFVRSGHAVFNFDHRHVRCNQESFVIMQPNTDLTVQAHHGDTCGLLCLRLTSEILIKISDEQTNLLESFNIAPFGVAAIKADSSSAMLCKNLAHSLYTSHETPLFGNELYVRGMLSMLIILVLRASIASDFMHPTLKRSHFMVDDLFVYIRDHLDEQISLQKLEQVFFVSHEHIAREFKKQTGQTVHQYIINLRLDKACQHLQYGETVVSVWRKCGFQSYSYFFQAFKHRFMVTPKQYCLNFAHNNADLLIDN